MFKTFWQKTIKFFLILFKKEEVLLLDNLVPLSPSYQDTKIKENSEIKVQNNIVPFVKREKSKSKDNFGSLYYLGDLLDNLQDYFGVLQYFKKTDFDNYQLYKKVGAQIVDRNTLLKVNEIDANLKKRPSFYMLHFNPDEEDEESDWMQARLIYFRKIKWEQGLQVTSDDIYRVCVYYQKGTKNHFNGEFYISVSYDGKIKVLKEQRIKYNTIYSKKYKQSISIPQVTWEPNAFLKHFLLFFEEKEKNNSDNPWKNKTIDDVAVHFFSIALNSFFHCYSGFQIHVKNKDGYIANFNIDMLRTPYFFKDRKKTVNQNGRTKKIFHIVRTHKRKWLDNETYVKTHFRGLRKFMWNDYEVLIENPKKEIDLRTIEIAGIDPENPLHIQPGEKYITSSELGKRINELRG